MSPDAPQEGEDPPEYALYGVVVHLDWMGSAHSGHYVSYVRLLTGGGASATPAGWRRQAGDGAQTESLPALLRESRARRPGFEPTRNRRVDRLEEAERERNARVEARRAAARRRDLPRAPPRAPPPGRVVPEHTVETVGIQRGTERENGDSSSSSDDDSDSCRRFLFPRRVVVGPPASTMSPLATRTAATRRDVVITASHRASAWATSNSRWIGRIPSKTTTAGHLR